MKCKALARKNSKKRDVSLACLRQSKENPTVEMLYRQLKQWRTAGHYSVLVKDLRELLDVPDTYETKAITNRVLNSAVNKLRKLYSFRNLTYEYSYSGKTAVRVKFDWDPEVIPQRKEAPSADWIAVDEGDDVFELRENISDLQKKAAR